MYHFVAEPSAVLPHELASLIPVRKSYPYLKAFQLEAVRFLYKHHQQRSFCVLNDESGLGKTATLAVFLNAAMMTKRRCLIIVPNDEALDGWHFHISLLTNLPASLLSEVAKSAPRDNSQPHIYLSKWSAFCSNPHINDENFDFIILDNRGEMLNNNFCCSTLLKHFQLKVNIIVSSVDITSDNQLLYVVLQLGGRLEHQFSKYKAFEQRFKLPDTKDIVNKTVDLEQYFLRREMLRHYCHDFRLRRYRHEYEQLLPLVPPERHIMNLAVWSRNHSSTIRKTETWREQNAQRAFMLQVPDLTNPSASMSTEDTVPPMSPLLFISDSDYNSDTDRARVRIKSENREVGIDLTINTEQAMLVLPETEEDHTLSGSAIQLGQTRQNGENETTMSGRKAPTMNGTQEQSIVARGETSLRRGRPRKTEKPRLPLVVKRSIEPRVTRNMNLKRLTRSAAASKKGRCLVQPLGSKPSRKENKTKSAKQTRANQDETASSGSDALAQREQENEKLTVRQSREEEIPQLPVRRPSQVSLISPSEDKEIECAQRLSHDSNGVDVATRIFHEGSMNKFVLPHPPPPLPPSDPLTMVMLPESTAAQYRGVDDKLFFRSLFPAQSRRTSALKGKRNTHERHVSKTVPVATRGAQSGTTRRSPDLFSNCSDLGLICMQEGNAFQAFSSNESVMKSVQQQHATQSNRLTSRKRSCLDLIEQICDNSSPTKLKRSILSTNTSVTAVAVQSNGGRPNKINYLERTQTQKSLLSKPRPAMPTDKPSRKTTKTTQMKTATLVQTTKLTRWPPRKGNRNGNVEAENSQGSEDGIRDSVKRHKMQRRHTISTRLQNVMDFK